MRDQSQPGHQREGIAAPQPAACRNYSKQAEWGTHPLNDFDNHNKGQPWCEVQKKYARLLSSSMQSTQDAIYDLEEQGMCRRFKVSYWGHEGFFYAARSKYPPLMPSVSQHAVVCRCIVCPNQLCVIACDCGTAPPPAELVINS